MPQPLGDGPQQRHADVELAPYDLEQVIAVDGQQRAIGFRDGARGARRLVDERHFPEDASRADPFDHLGSDRYRDSPLEHHVQEHPAFVLFHDHLASGIVQRGAFLQRVPQGGEKPVVEDASFRGAFPVRQASRHAQHGHREPQAVDHDVEQHEPEFGRLLDCTPQLLRVEGQRAARAARHRACAARGARDRGHFPEDLVALDDIEASAAAAKVDLALGEQIHLVAHVVLGEKGTACGNRLLGAERLETHPGENRVVAPGAARRLREVEIIRVCVCHRLIHFPYA